MYNPSAFLISAAALTSIFSFFFGGYYQERDKTYALWLKVVAYGQDSSTEDEISTICSKVESRERLLRQAKGLLAIILITLIAQYVVFQYYSYPYVSPYSEAFTPEAYHTYRWYNTIIGIIILINCLEMLYIRIAVDRDKKFPYLKLRKRVSGQERLSEIWRALGCRELKLPEHERQRIPEKFYQDLENAGEIEPPPET